MSGEPRRSTIRAQAPASAYYGLWPDSGPGAARIAEAVCVGGVCVCARGDAPNAWFGSCRSGQIGRCGRRAVTPGHREGSVRTPLLGQRDRARTVLTSLVAPVWLAGRNG